MNRIIILFAFAALAIAGCKKEDAEPSFPGNFTINAKTYSVSGMYWVDLGIGSARESYSIVGTNSKEQIKMYVNLSGKSTGDIIVGVDNEVVLEIGNDDYISTSGKIVVNKFEDVASGTFDCQFTKSGSTETIHGTGKFEANEANFDI